MQTEWGTWFSKRNIEHYYLPSIWKNETAWQMKDGMSEAIVKYLSSYFYPNRSLWVDREYRLEEHMVVLQNRINLLNTYILKEYFLFFWFQ